LKLPTRIGAAVDRARGVAAFLLAVAAALLFPGENCSRCEGALIGAIAATADHVPPPLLRFVASVMSAIVSVRATGLGAQP
jgi:hypothetical protein